MTKYVELDVEKLCGKNRIYGCVFFGDPYCDDCPFDSGYGCRMVDWLEELPTIEVSEENELKFYYVESIDDYWIGRRLDNFYYAEWKERLGFVWTHSRYLPWGEHVVAEHTLWKEHTYPSEPREIPFAEWIVGFMKKYVPKVSEDCISRTDLIQELLKDAERVEMEEFANDTVWRTIGNAPSIVPTVRENRTVERSEGEWIPCSERLPNKYKAVLTTSKDGRVRENFINAGGWSHDTYAVIAWMPLPEPWKG